MIAYVNRWFFSYVTSTGPHAITYQVTGEGSARVTYATADGRQTVSASLPWEVTVTVPDGTALSVAATAESTGSITCRIKWEGHTIGLDLESGNGGCGTT